MDYKNEASRVRAHLKAKMLERHGEAMLPTLGATAAYAEHLERCADGGYCEAMHKLYKALQAVHMHGEDGDLLWLEFAKEFADEALKIHAGMEAGERKERVGMLAEAVQARIEKHTPNEATSDVAGTAERLPFYAQR